MLHSLRYSRRLLSIAIRLLPARLSRRPGKRLAASFERLGPAFIKLGQVMSTRSDLIGEEMADDLSSLRDSLPPFSTVIARATIEKELGAPVDTLFASFGDIPVAAASIAQVHRATTKDGRSVAVKILRPGIEEAFVRDMELFSWLAEIVERRVRGWRRLKAREVVRTLKESVFFELDLRFEAAAATELAENIKTHEPGFRVPAIEWGLTSKRVLVLEWIDGIPFNDVAAIRNSGFDVGMILGKAARSLFSQIFIDGFFHADLHPGNLFVDRNGDIAAVDFGIMGRLDWKSRVYIAEILRGFVEGDYQRVAQVHFDAGYVPETKSREAFTQACMAVAKPITGKPLNEISVAKLLGQMFAIAAEFEMETQPQLLLMQKTMMVTEGVGRMLNPNLNIWELARPLIEKWSGENFGAAAKAKEAARQGYEIARKLPTVLGYIERNLRMAADDRGIRLHPDTIEELNRERRSRNRQWLALGWIGLIAAMAIAMTH